MNCICFMNFSKFISRNLVHVILKMFIVSAAYFGSTVSPIQVNISIFRNTIIQRTPLYTNTIVVRGYINFWHLLELHNKEPEYEEKN